MTVLTAIVVQLCQCTTFEYAQIWHTMIWFHATMKLKLKKWNPAPSTLGLHDNARTLLLTVHNYTGFRGHQMHSRCTAAY